ncbi:MAG TPA: hypothetical protein VFY92_06055 [Hyphomicrobiaceae bacterium]|nr:hypothetical protein [Hyphomicrobiaceae bacterium]
MPRKHALASPSTSATRTARAACGSGRAAASAGACLPPAPPAARRCWQRWSQPSWRAARLCSIRCRSPPGARSPAGRACHARSPRRETGYAHDEEETIADLSRLAGAIPRSHAGGGHVAISISISTKTLTAKRKATIKVALDDIIATLRDRI